MDGVNDAGGVNDANDANDAGDAGDVTKVRAAIDDLANELLVDLIFPAVLGISARAANVGAASASDAAGTATGTATGTASDATSDATSDTTDILVIPADRCARLRAGWACLRKVCRRWEALLPYDDPILAERCLAAVGLGNGSAGRRALLCSALPASPPAVLWQTAAVIEQSVALATDALVNPLDISSSSRVIFADRFFNFCAWLFDRYVVPVELLFFFRCVIALGAYDLVPVMFVDKESLTMARRIANFEPHIAPLFSLPGQYVGISAEWRLGNRRKRRKFPFGTMCTSRDGFEWHSLGLGAYDWLRKRHLAATGAI